jgi:arginyl-tRNA synthetase
VRAVTDPVSELRRAVGEAASSLWADGGLVLPHLERPPKPELGDYSSNAAMLLAPALGQPPREVAKRIGEALGERLGPAVHKVEVAGPGFLNLFVSDAWCCAALAGAIESGDGYGAGGGQARERVNVEFVSANPTGPLTVASGRHAAYGDALCRILEMAGDEVEREYYVNDRGGQIERFAGSIRARAKGVEPPPDGYQGDYVKELADGIDGAADLHDRELARRGVEAMVEQVRGTLERFRVRIDRFASERALHEDGRVSRALEKLEQRQHLYLADGALWLRTTTFGDDKDRVLKRSSGEMTYFAADVAYHEDKRARGYDRIIDLLGADHHGYVGRMRAAWEALGGEPDRFEIVIMQLVSLLEGGRRAQMSKRQGEFVSLDDLLNDIGVDATRWFLLQRSHDTALDIDLELARRQSQDNPVYYAQYAHARIASILRKAGEERLAAALGADLAASHERLHPSARALVKRLLEFPGMVQEAAVRRSPHRLTTYVTETAQDFSAFYRDCKVVGAAGEGGDEDLRMAICEVTRRVIARGLDLLGVSAPRAM